MLFLPDHNVDGALGTGARLHARVVDLEAYGTLIMSARRKNLMQGLYYPAVLGTGMVIVLFRMTLHPSIGSALTDFGLYFGVFFLGLFSGCFLAISDVPAEEYGLGKFVIDLLEVGLMFLAYYWAGLFDTNKIQILNLPAIYLVLASAVILQQIWSALTTALRSRQLWKVRIVTLAVLFLGAIFGRNSFWVNVIVLLLLYSLLIKYFWSFRSGTPLAPARIDQSAGKKRHKRKKGR